MEFADILIGVALFLFFLLMNSFFVAAEFALVKVRSTQIEELIKRKDWRAKVVKEMIHNINPYLSAVQVGVTIASLAMGWLGEPYLATWIRPLLAMPGLLSEQAVHTASVVISFSLITTFLIVLSELTPKTLAILKPVETSLWVAYPLKAFFIIFKPVIHTLNKLAGVSVRLVGLKPVDESEVEHSAEELRLLLMKQSNVSHLSREMLISALEFRKKQARHIMTSRRDIVALGLEDTLAENVEIMRKNKYSRYPATMGTLDNVPGIVHTKDIFKHERHLESGFRLENVLRDAVFMPETVTLEKVLEMMLQKKTHMILLADEYGSTSGLVTLENVLEELVGAIQDEFDRETPEVVTLGPDEYLVDASMTTNDVERLLDRELSPKDILSIGGYVTELIGHLPKPGEVVRVEGAMFTVEKVSDNAIEQLRVQRLPLDSFEKEET